MTESPANEDCESIQSDESNLSITTKKEKLESLVNMELKHSGVYYDLHWKNNLLKVDLENLSNSCQRFESQKKSKSELLEELHDKLTDLQKRNKIQLKEKFSSVVQKLKETDNLFYNAFEDYSSDALKISIESLDSEIDRIKKKLMEKQAQLSALQSKRHENLLKAKSNKISNIDKAVKMIFECSLKRPEIEMEGTLLKLENEIKKLEEKRKELKSSAQKLNK